MTAKAKESETKIQGVPCQLVGTEGTLNAVIINATHDHILVDLGPKILHVHKIYQVKFLVPEVNSFVDAESVVLKTRDEWQSSQNKGQAGAHIAELVFKNLTTDQRRAMSYMYTYFQTLGTKP